jgi:hypothetical protein
MTTTPAAAATPATAEKPAFREETREVAMQVFVELVARNVVIAENNVKMAVSAENLAKLSYKLAAAFLAVHEELNRANMPTNPTYKLDADDIASWTK